VENEARLRHQIRQALDPIVPEAPWLRANVREALRGQAQEPRQLFLRLALPAWSGARSVVAILLLVAIVAALLVGSRAMNSFHKSPAHPDAALQKYQAVVDRGWSSIENLVLYGTPGTCNEGRRADCAEKVQTTRAAAQKFLDELDSVPVPPGLAPTDAQLRMGLAHVIAALDAMLSALDHKDFAAYSTNSGHLFDAKIDEVYPNAVAVHCWPKAAVHGFDAAGYDVIRCGATTAQEYLTSIANGWLSLRGSLDSSRALCSQFNASCGDRSRQSKQLAQQFKNDLNRTPAPIQYVSAEEELDRGLDTLIAALDDRLAAISADDRNRWDSVNVAIEQINFNVLEKSVAEMACWPKGVHIGDDTSTAAWPCSG
jgi:hypothetical protein